MRPILTNTPATYALRTFILCFVAGIAYCSWFWMYAQGRAMQVVVLTDMFAQALHAVLLVPAALALVVGASVYAAKLTVADVAAGAASGIRKRD